MRRRFISAAALILACVTPPVATAQPAAAATATSEKPEPQEKPRSQVPSLGRPTKPDDPAPRLDFFDYFKGPWQFTWDYPDSPLGPAGTLEGTTRFAETKDGHFEAMTTATSPSGPVTIREVIRYQREQQTMSRTVTDSRGFTYVQNGTVAGDLGGQFTIRLESEPFTHGGATLRIRTVMRLLSPYNYRVQTQISVNGSAFTNYGNPWWRKEGASQ